MNKVFLFQHSVNDRNDIPYDVEFLAGENNEVSASISSQDGKPLYKNVGLVDLFGRRTKVPAIIHLALKAQSATEQQKQLLERFQRICIARLAWSLGCCALLEL